VQYPHFPRYLEGKAMQRLLLLLAEYRQYQCESFVIIIL